jgi:hypothetical protein
LGRVHPESLKPDKNYPHFLNFSFICGNIMQSHPEVPPEWLETNHNGSKPSLSGLEQQLSQQQQQLRDIGTVLNHLTKSIQNQHLICLEQDRLVGEIHSKLEHLVNNQSQLLNQGKTISTLYEEVGTLGEHQIQLQEKIDRNSQILNRHTRAFSKYVAWKATAIRYGIIALILFTITVAANMQHHQQITKLQIRIEQIWQQVKPR